MDVVALGSLYFPIFFLWPTFRKPLDAFPAILFAVWYLFFSLLWTLIIAIRSVAINLVVLMTIKVNFVAMGFQKRLVVIDQRLVVVVEAKHRVMHVRSLPNYFLVLQLFFHSSLDPLHLLVALLNK